MAQPANRILQGDCRETLKTLPDACIDLVFADPPYNLQLKGALRRPDQSKVAAVDDAWDKFSSFKEYDHFTAAWLAQCRRVLKPSGALWVIGAYHNIYRVGAALQDLGFWILNDIVWIKSNPMPNFKGARFCNAHETLLWAARDEKAKFTFNYQTMKAFNGDLQMRSDWLIPICSGKERLRDSGGGKAHSTQKPEALLKRIILATTRPGDVILDPFFGSGTTGAVAKLLNRRYIGIEKESRYIHAARERIRKVRPCKDEHTLLHQEIPKPKVPFGRLVEAGYVKAGTKLYSKDRRHQATVLADGTLKNGRHGGSIHRVGAAVQGKDSSNGWTFWHLEKNSTLVSIDRLRERYFAEKS